jgi:hypothetical protein
VIYESDVAVGRDGSVAMFFEATRPRRSLAADGMDLREQIHRHEFYRRIDSYLRKARAFPSILAAVPGAAYVVNTGGSAIALTGATAKTIMYLNAGASNQSSLSEMCVGFDGVTAANVPALVEVVFGTKATNATPGTASTAFTPLQIRGWPTQASIAAAANTCTSEPTVLTSLKQWLLTPNGGLLVVSLPMGKETTGVASGTAISGNQFGVRVNAPVAVNTRGYFEYDE